MIYPFHQLRNCQSPPVPRRRHGPNGWPTPHWETPINGGWCLDWMMPCIYIYIYIIIYYQISRAPGILWFLGNIGYQGQDAIFGAVYARKGRTKKKKQRHGLHGFALDQPSINGIGPINRSEYIGNGRKQSATVCIYYVYIINGDFMGILILTVYRLLTIYIYVYIYICIYIYIYMYICICIYMYICMEGCMYTSLKNAFFRAAVP